MEGGEESGEEGGEEGGSSRTVPQLKELDQRRKFPHGFHNRDRPRYVQIGPGQGPIPSTPGSRAAICPIFAEIDSVFGDLRMRLKLAPPNSAEQRAASEELGAVCDTTRKQAAEAEANLLENDLEYAEAKTALREQRRRKVAVRRAEEAMVQAERAEAEAEALPARRISRPPVWCQPSDAQQELKAQHSKVKKRETIRARYVVRPLCPHTAPLHLHRSAL